MQQNGVRLRNIKSQETSSQVHSVLSKRSGLAEDLWTRAMQGLTGRVKRGREPESLLLLIITTFDGSQ